MKTINLPQGSADWHAHRLSHNNASDAPAMMGCSPYQSRTDLLTARKTGLRAEVDAATQRRFDEGHRFEALARPVAEKIIGEPLYPLVGVNGNESASLDGITIAEEIVMEHKRLNADLRAVFSLADRAVDDGTIGRALPLMYQVQMEQQLHVSGADKVLFMATEWADDGTLLDEVHCWYYPNLELRARILAGWRQFERDLETFVPPVAEAAKPQAAPIAQLPALMINLTGQVTSSNLPAFKEAATALIARIRTDLKTDQDFADGEAMVRFCKDGEERLELVKAQALEQTASIAEVFRVMDEIREQLRGKRLALDTAIKQRKQFIRMEIAKEYADKLSAYLDTMDKELGTPLMPDLSGDWAGAMKGLKSITSIRDACEVELANRKMEANETFRRIQQNLKAIAEHGGGLDSLFYDRPTLVLKPCDDCLTTIQMRVTQHRAQEEARLAQAQAQESARLAAQAAKAQAPAPATVTALPPAAANAPIPRPASTRAGVPNLTIKTIQERLGLAVTAAFIETVLGISPAKREQRAMFFLDTDWDRICLALMQHVDAARSGYNERQVA